MATERTVISKVYTKESFLEMIIENYKDYIKNMVLKFQKYDDIINKYTMELYNFKSMKDLDETYIEILSFLRTEGENIFRMKGVSFIKECRDVLSSKFKLLRSGLKTSGTNAQYYFNQEAFQFFIDHINQINWSMISNDVYSNGLILEESFTEVMDEMFMAYNFHEFKSSPTIYYCDPLVVLLDDCFKQLIDTMTRLKTLAEESRSSHLTLIIAREALDIMIMVYASIKTISEVRE